MYLWQISVIHVCGKMSCNGKMCFVNDRIKNDNTYNYYHYNNQVKVGPQYKE